jgi:hemerythrin
MGVKMGKICWKEKYSVGVEKFDSQHRHLFEIINKFAERSCSSEDIELIYETLTELANYAREHLTEEEELMQEYDYPGIFSQKRQHAYFLDTIRELSESVREAGYLAGGEIAEFLRLWWTAHILRWDMKYKEFFKTRIHAGTTNSI